MWNRILGKASDLEKKSSTSESSRKSESHRSTPHRSGSQKSTTSSRKTTRSDDHDRGFNPTSTSYSSTTQNRYPGTASASVASSYATAFNDPTNQDYLPPGLVRNASLADQIPKSRPEDGQRPVALDRGGRPDDNRDDPAIMEERPRRKERRGTRDKDEDRRESKSHRDKKRRNSGKGSERAMSTDEVAYSTSQRGDEVPTTSYATESSAFVPLADQHDSRVEYTNDRPHAQSSHVQDQFPGQFPTQSAAPYRPPFAAREGGPGLAAEYYGDAGQSVVDQPGVRIHSPSLIVGAEPHLQAASIVAAPPPEPSSAGGVGAAAAFFDGTFSAGSDMEGHPSQKPAPITGSSSIPYSSATQSTSTYATSSGRPSAQQSSSVPILPTIGSAAAGAAAGYYMNSRPSKTGRPVQDASSTVGFGKISANASHYEPSETNASYTSYPSSSRPPTKTGKSSSQSSNIPLYVAGAAGAGMAAAAYHNNHHGATHYGSTHHGFSQHPSSSQHYGGSTMAQQLHHRHHGPFSKLVDFFKDPDGVAQFEEYTEYIGVCRHCFDPRSSPRDAPRRHQYRRRRSNERYGSNGRVDKDHRYSSSESESRRRKKEKSWLGAGIAGYGLGKMGESLFLNDNSSHESHGNRHGRVKSSHRRRRSSSSERKSRTSYGVVNRSSDTVSRKSRSKDRAETGITSDGKIYRKNSHGSIDTSKVKLDTSRHRSRSRSGDRHGNISNIALGAALGSSVVASQSRRRSKSPKKAFVRSKHGHKESNSGLASILNLNESDSRNSRHRSRSSPESRHRTDRRKEKKSRGFFSFSNSSSSSSSDAGFGKGHDPKQGRRTKSKSKGKENRDTEAALLGLGAAALAFNQSQRPKRKSELIAVKESKGKHKVDKHGHQGKRSSSSSEEDLWESASEGDYSSADSELAYGGSLHRRSRESLSSDSSGLDKWNWRWGSKKQPKRSSKDRHHSSTFDTIGPVAATSAMMTGAAHLPPSLQNQDSRMTSSSSIPLQHVYPMPTSDPTQFDVANHDIGAPSYQPLVNARPDPVPIQHPQPVAPVSSAVYTSQAPYSHSYSAPIGVSSGPEYSHPASFPNHDVSTADPRNNLPGAFPAAHEYFESPTRNHEKDLGPRRRESSPVTNTPEYTPSSAASRRRRSIKDDASSVRFDLTKEQEDKDRRDERRRQKEEAKRRERLVERESDEGKDSIRQTGGDDPHTIDSDTRLSRESRDGTNGVNKEAWAAPAAAGVIAAAVGATMAAAPLKNDKSGHERRADNEERDIEVIVRERPSLDRTKKSSQGRGRSSESEHTGMSVWQAAAKVKRSSSHTEYAAYFTPTELLSKEPGVKETVGANADNDITVYQAPNMITIQPSEPVGSSPSRAFSFPITAEDMEHSVKPLPWAVPQLNLVEATPPPSRTGSVVGSRSPRVRSPLSNEIPDIPLEPLESVVTPDPITVEPAHVEYTVIEPKGHSEVLVDSPVNDMDTPESVPGISSLKKKQKPRTGSSRDVGYRDDPDSSATVAAGLQNRGFDPSIAAADLSFRRRDPPSGSEDGADRRRPTTTVTEITPELPSPPSPPHGFVEELDEPHLPGSFQEDEYQTSQRRREKEAITDRKGTYERSRTPVELTGPSDNAGREPNVYSTEEDAFKQEDLTNAAIDPVGDRPYKGHEQARHNAPPEDATKPSDNAGIKPHVYTAEPEPLEPEAPHNVTIDPIPTNQRSVDSVDHISQTQPRIKASTNGDADVLEYASDDAPSMAASAPVASSRRKDSKSSKKSKRRSVGFDDTTSVISSPPTYGGAQETSSASKSGRKGGIFGLFSKSTDNLPESKGIRQTPTEANLEDFEEPRERRKKSKSRRQDRDDEEMPPVSTESVVSSQPEAQDDWDTPKKSKRGKEKRRSSGDPGRITQDLPAQVIPPAPSGHDPFPASNEMLTSLEDHEPGHSRKESRSDEASFEETDKPSRIHDNEQPSFLGERPEKPPLPDTPDASADPGGQIDLQQVVQMEQSLQSPASPSEASSIKPERPIRPVSDLQSDGRSVSYSSASPTAIPLRPLRFGRRPSSPGLAKSLPSTPQPLTTGDGPVTPRRRDRPHSTEFKSNEFRPMWLLEKYGSRDEPTPQETYPSLPSSHSTSRASSVHGSDELYQTEALDLALDEANYRRIMQEPRGLKIDTSHHEDEPELLDSQQATPTAASFQAMVKEGDMHSVESALKSTSGSQEPNLEPIDLVSPASEYHDPLNEPFEDQRLLHSIEDVFPQRRASSPARYDAGSEARLVEQSLSDATEFGPMEKQVHDVLESVSPSTASDLLDVEQSPKTEVGMAYKSATGGPERPTAEETRLMQEQDAQDAVDSWFAPAQPKRPQLGKKGRKRGKSYDESQSKPATDPSDQLDEQQLLTTSGNQSRSVLGDTALTSEPGEAIPAPALRDVPGEPVADLNYQAALTSRRDSTKGKKKKNKRKTTDPLEEPTGEFPGLTSELQLDPESNVGKTSILMDSPMIAPASIEHDATKEFPVPLAETENLSKTEAPDLATEAETYIAPTKKNKKGKKKNRSLSLVDPEQDQIPEPVIAGLAENEPSTAFSTEVPYASSAIGEPKPEGSMDPVQEAVQPSPKDIRVESQSSGPPAELKFDKGPEDETSEVTFTPAAKSLDLEEVPPTQRSGGPEAEPQVSPKAIPLPLDDDLDLLDALPESPVLQPIDAQSAVQEQSSGNDVPSIVEPAVSTGILDGSLAEASNIEPTTLNKVISELTLPQSSAAADQVEKEEADVFSLSASKKSKRDKKNKKGKGFAAPAFETGASIEEEPALLASASPINEAEEDLMANLGPPSKNEQQSFTAPATTEYSEGLPKETVETFQEQPAEEWPDFTTKKSKKGKKGKKDKPIREEPRETDPGSAATVIGPAPVEPFKAATAVSEHPTPLEIPEVNVGTKEQGADPTSTFPSKLDPSELTQEATTPVVEGPDEWPTASKKKKKGKKNKGAPLDDFDEAQSKESDTATLTERSEAATGTASEVQNLLQGSALEDSGRYLENRDSETSPIAELEISPDPPLDQPSAPALNVTESASEHIAEAQMQESSLPGAFPQESVSESVDDRTTSETTTSAETPLSGAKSGMMASTETATEVQELLSKAGEQESLEADQPTSADLEQAAEVDDFAWAPSKKKRKGKKSKSSEEAVSTDTQKPDDEQHQESLEPDTLLPTGVAQNEPADEFETNKSKKDKKSKRKGLSRSIGDFEPQEASQEVPFEVEEPIGDDMVMTDNAPSVLEKADQLPSLELPISPEAGGPMSSSIQPNPPETPIAVEEPDASAITRGVDIDPISDESGPLTTAEGVPHLPQVEEVEMFADAPSFMEKREDSPDIEPYPPQDSRDPLIDRDGAALTAAAGQTFNATASPSHDLASPTADHADTTLASEQLTRSTEILATPTAEDEPMIPFPKGESDQAAADEFPTIDETTHADLEPSFETPAKSKSKKSRVSDWVDDSLGNVPEPSIEPAEVTKDAKDGNIEQPSGELAVDPEAVPTQAFPMSKKDKKKSKKAKQLAWDEGVPEASTEAIEPPTEFIEAEHEQPSENTTEDIPTTVEEPFQSKKSKKSKKSKALAMEEGEEPKDKSAAEAPEVDVPVKQATLADDLPAEPTEPSAEILFESASSKKGKKKGKKSKFVAWDEEEPVVPTLDEPQQQDVAPKDVETVDDDPDITVEVPTAETLEEHATAKKSKGKGKKSKFVDFEDEPSSTPAIDEETPLIQTPLEPESNAEVPSDILQPPQTVEKIADIPDEQPKKSKKSKKSKFVDFTEESTLPLPTDETSTRDSITTEPEFVSEEPNKVPEQTKAGESSIDTFEQPSSKKGKKKGKKSKFVDWDGEPPSSVATEKRDQQKTTPTESQVAVEEIEDIPKPTEEKESAMLADDTPTAPTHDEESAVLPVDGSPIPKKKKKGKTSKFVDWDDEPTIPSVQDSADQQASILTDPDLGIEQVRESRELAAEPIGEEEVAQPPNVARKEKKKGKKSKFVAWDDEPSVPSVEDGTAMSLSDKAPEVDQTPFSLPKEDDGVAEASEDVVMSMPKSKKDKKKAKKAKTLSWEDEEPTPAIEEGPIIPSTDADLHQGSDDQTPKFPDETAADVHESIPADQTQNQIEETTTMETGEPLPTFPVATDAEAADDVVISRLAPLESTDETTIGEHSIPTVVPEKILEPSDEVPHRPLSTPADDNIAALNASTQNLAKDYGDVEPSEEFEKHGHKVEATPSPTPDQIARDASPLLLQVDDVLAGPASAPSIEDAPKTAEGRVSPVAPDEGSLDRTASLVDPANEPLDPSSASAALDHPGLANEQGTDLSQQLTAHALDFPAEAPIQPGEGRLQAPETGADDVVEEFAFVSNKDKKKAKKSKKAMAWEDEAEALVTEEVPAIVEKNEEEDMTSDQPTPLPSTTSEKPLEDPVAISRKDKKKGKKKNKAFSFDDEPAESMTPVEPDLKAEATDPFAEEPILPTQPATTEEVGEFQTPSKKDKKKGKRSKNVFDFNDEPSPNIQQVEDDIEVRNMDQTQEEPSLPTVPSISEDVGSAPLSKKDRKKSKKSKPRFDFDEEPPSDALPAEPSFEEMPTGQVEETAMPIEPFIATPDEGFPNLSKDKKKSKKNRQAVSFDEEPTEDTMTADPEPEPIADENVAEPTRETSLLPEPNVAIVEEDPPFPSKKSKKSKKDRKAVNFDEEPSESTTPAEPEPIIDDSLAGSIAEPMISPVFGVTTAEEEFPETAKKNKKSKKGNKAFSLDDEPSESMTTPAEPILGEEPAEGTMQLSMSAETGVTLPEEESPETRKKNKKSKKAQKAFILDDEPSESLTPAESETLERDIIPDQPAPPTEASLTEATEKFALPTSKKDKKSKKAKKALMFDEAPPESLIPAESESLERDMLPNQPAPRTEESFAETNEDFPSSTGNKEKKSKKNKKALNFDDGPVESTKPTASEDLEQDALLDQPPAAAGEIVAEAFEDFSTTSNKKEKKSKKKMMAVAFEDEPLLDTGLPETIDPTTEERAVPTESGVLEAIDEFDSLSKKDRKKAKKGKKTSAFDEPLESPMAVESSAPYETTGADVPEDTFTESKKDKKKAKKAKKAFGWDDETVEAGPAFDEGGPPVEQMLQVDSAVPSVSQQGQSQELETSQPRDTSPILSPRPDGAETMLEAHPTGERPITDVMADMDESVRIDTAEQDDFPEAPEPKIFVTSKKSKKDKKKAKKSQAFDCGDDADASKSPLPEITRPAEDMPSPLPEIPEGQMLPTVSEPADSAASPSVREKPELMLMTEPPATSPLVEPERAPRHEDPTLTTPADSSTPFERPPSPPPEKSLDQQDYTSVQQRVEDPETRSVAPAVESIEEQVQPIARETSLPIEEELPSFAPTKKSKKGKKAKKQVIDWEDDTIPPPPAQEPSKATGVIEIASRPEMSAWPTEVRLNQATTPVQIEEQSTDPVDVVDDTSLAQDPYLPDEPQEPPPVEDDRTDYFGHEPSRDFPSQPEPFEDDALFAPPSPAPLPSSQDSPSKAESSIVQDDIAGDTSREEADRSAATADELQPRDVAAGPVDEFEGFATTKKEKKSKRKKKQALDDVMWEFPSIPFTADVTPVESKWPSDPSRGDRLYREQEAAAATKEPQDFAGTKGIVYQELREATPSEQAVEAPGAMPRQAGKEGEPEIAEEPRTEDAPEDDSGAVSRTAKKGKKSKKSKATDYFAEPEPEPESEPSSQPAEEVGHPSQTDKKTSTPDLDTIESIAAAAAISAGLATAEGLSRRESKKDKKKKKGRQASGTLTEPEEESTRRDEAIIEGDGSNLQSRVPTPERRSPIQAWHQNISPTQSPRHSELYDLEDERPRSSNASRRKRSHDAERRQSQNGERRSPIEAWHQYDTPGQSPRQSELYQYDRREGRGADQHTSTGAVNRDSGVHVLDSPVVSQHSPVRRAMRDSGYPDTDASPVVSQGVEKQEHIQGSAREFGQGDRESIGANPLQISTEGVPKERQQKKRTRSRSPRHENDDEDLDLPARHARPRSFDDVREPSPVSSTTKDRSSVLFQSSPSTREEQGQAQVQGSPMPREHHHDDTATPPHSAGRSLTPPREDNSAVVNARAESLAALSGLRGPNQDQGGSLFGGPIGISSDGNSPETPMDQEGSNRRRLNTITEYSPEESPLHKKNRDVSDVGVSAHGVKAARRSGTPQAISKRRARSPLAESTPADEPASRPFWPPMDDEKQPMDLERSRSRNTEQRPSSHQSNISSLVSGPPKEREYERRSFSGASNHSIESINAIIRTPPDQMRSTSGMSNRSSGTPPLRRADRSVSNDLRSANLKSEANKRAKQPEAEPQEIDTSIPIPPPSTTPHDATKDKSKSKGRVRGMADVFEGYGDSHGSPLSPTRPPSVRRRQSMQVLELESRNDRLVAENRQLHEAKLRAERDSEDAAHNRSEEVDSYREGIESREAWLRQKDTELSQLKETIETLEAHVTQLEDANQELQTSSRGLDDHQEQYSRLEEEHAEIHQQWQQSTRELQDLRQQHTQLSAGMEDIVRHEVTTALESKNSELHTLQSSLSSAQAQIRTLQAQLLASTSKQQSSSSDSLLSRDEDYFDTLCSTLHHQITQWVLRFSKFSDSRTCYLSPEIRDSAIVDRIENSILDGTDADLYLSDRIKRRDIFMSIVMTMIWEYIFTRYLFGADRDLRQKLKSIEKLLSDTPSNSRSAIHKWRATTLHLLSKREQFAKQRDADTEAVTETIYETLATILPPPSHLVGTVKQGLGKVVAKCVELSVEMRVQRWEYVMLPPLQPEYDTHGDLARKVYFNASLMNCRGGGGDGGEGNEELERRKAVVRIVLFPLVVRKGEVGDGNTGGEGDAVEEIVVWPAQVLVAEPESDRAVDKRGSAVEMGGMF
ncbi:MAG: hypothetical protein Q9169_002827 [Polycauliona sp. 2 TL-2023]